MVPESMVKHINEHPESMIYDIWVHNGAKQEGVWKELFGKDAEELFTAYYITVYINSIAAEGKKLYDLPLYVNVWLDDCGWNAPSLDYPAGGPIPKVLEIWKQSAPNLDFIAPDIYKQDKKGFCEYCSYYSNEDNPLFLPETGWGESNSRNMFVLRNSRLWCNRLSYFRYRKCFEL